MPLYNFISRMNLSALKWETRRERRKRCKRERQEGREFIMRRCELAGEDYRLGNYLHELIRESNYVQRILDREFQDWTNKLARRGVLLTNKIADILAQIDGNFMVESLKHRLYRTTVHSTYLTMKNRHQFRKNNAETYRQLRQLADTARRAKWDDLSKTYRGRRICNHQGVPYFAAFTLYRPGNYDDFRCQYEPKFGHRPPVSFRYWQDWHRIERRKTVYEEDWNDLVCNLKETIMSSRRARSFDPTHIKPQWYCTQKAILELYKQASRWTKQDRSRVHPKLAAESRSRLAKTVAAAGLGSYMHGRDHSKNRSPPLKASDASSWYSGTVDDYSGDDASEENDILRLLTAANAESCMCLLDSIEGSRSSQRVATESILSDRTGNYHTSSSNDKVQSELTENSANSQTESCSDAYRMLMHAFYDNICEEIENIRRPQFTEDDTNTSSAVGSEKSVAKSDAEGKKPRSGDSINRTSKHDKDVTSESSDQDSRKSGALMLSVLTKLLLNAFYRSIFDALHKLQSSDDQSPVGVEEVVQAALEIVGDEQLFSDLFHCVSHLLGSPEASDTSSAVYTEDSRDPKDIMDDWERRDNVESGVQDQPQKLRLRGFPKIPILMKSGRYTPRHTDADSSVLDSSPLSDESLRYTDTPSQSYGRYKQASAPAKHVNHVECGGSAEGQPPTYTHISTTVTSANSHPSSGVKQPGRRSTYRQQKRHEKRTPLC